jgi:hypothetical protein
MTRRFGFITRRATVVSKSAGETVQRPRVWIFDGLICVEPVTADQMFLA